MIGFKRITETLKQNLSKDLPGLDAQIKMAPTFRGGVGINESPNLTTRRSAVLICIYPYKNRTNTILIKRSVYNGVHSGQISFPGGKHEESDQNLTATALRETHEEIGVEPNSVEIIGELTPLFIPVSNMMVLPVIGVLAKKPKLHLNVQEVEYAIEANLLDFQCPDNLSVKTLCINNTPISAPFFSIGHEMVWGATAMIISELIELF